MGIDFTELVDLAAEKVGGAVLVANDEFFAPKENLLKVGAPIFVEGKYTDLGKWMDGWETRRRRTPGFDWCVIRLGLPGIVRGVVDLQSDAINWMPLLPQMPLNGDTQNLFAVEDEQRATHLRFKIYPDGGVARLRVYGEVLPDWDRLQRIGGDVDLAAVENGGRVVSCSDMFFGHRHNLIMPGRAANMSDGWETKRRRGPGHDWVIIQLGTVGQVRRLEVDTAWFKGNSPESCSLEATHATDSSAAALADLSVVWKSILPRTKLQAHTRHFFENEVLDAGRVSHLRFNIFPDGGVSRLRVYGKLA